MTSDRPLSAAKALLWILCLAALSVGARNFEEGLSIDAPLYCTIARNIVRNHEWFVLYGGVPDFVPFAEHPHLGFWLLAGVFKILPAADWSGRIVGHFFYVAFLWIFFLYLRHRSSQRTAIWTVIILWVWYRFANFFSNVYLDPGLLFFGSGSFFLWDLSLEKLSKKFAGLAGLSLGLAFLYKGLAILGFLPAMALLFLYWLSKGEFRSRGVLLALGLLGFGVVLLGYQGVLQLSSVPNFLEHYLDRQFFGRVKREWLWSNLVWYDFWISLVRDTEYLFPLVLLAAFRWRSINVWLPAVLLMTFIMMYINVSLVAHQYWITVLPWAAWLIAEGTLSRIPWDPRPLVKGTAIFSVVMMAALQYIPARTHGIYPPKETPLINEIKQKRPITKLWIDTTPDRTHFGHSAVYAWYADIDTFYLENHTLPEPTRDAILMNFFNEKEHEKQLELAGWCLYDKSWRGLWISCRE